VNIILIKSYNIIFLDINILASKNEEINWNKFAEKESWAEIRKQEKEFPLLIEIEYNKQFIQVIASVEILMESTLRDNH
jgi:MinD superfamily P-loop ATPase